MEREERPDVRPAAGRNNPLPPENLDRSVPPEEKKPDEPVNPDPAADERGAHAAGTGIGAAAGGIAGAAAGSVAGPLGMAAGAAIGAAAGGLMGRAVAETIDPTREDEYWRHQYEERPYVEAGTEYEQYQPAYRFGWEAFQRHGHEYRSFDEADAALKREWDRERGESAWDWSRARAPARDAWNKVATTERNRPHSAGRDA